MATLSSAQFEALQLLIEGPLVRWKGGFWALANEPSRDAGTYLTPHRSTTAQTLKALEARGLIESEASEPRWAAPKFITQSGRDALAEYDPAAPILETYPRVIPGR